MRDQYRGDLDKLNFALTQMGGMCEEAIRRSVKIMLTGNYDCADSIIAYDQEIDRMEKQIESMCIDLIQCQQPVAGDLRLISSALKIITDMERIGDQSADIAEIASRGNLGVSDQESHLVQMALEASKMVTDSLDAFVQRDIQKAEMVIEYDDVVDNLFEQIKQDMILSIQSKRSNIEFVIDMLMIAKYFERIADHATNIAEWAFYVAKGQQKGVKAL